jgi:hypothetical protein
MGGFEDTSPGRLTGCQWAAQLARDASAIGSRITLEYERSPLLQPSRSGAVYGESGRRRTAPSHNEWGSVGESQIPPWVSASLAGSRPLTARSRVADGTTFPHRRASGRYYGYVRWRTLRSFPGPRRPGPDWPADSVPGTPYDRSSRRSLLHHFAARDRTCMSPPTWWGFEAGPP